MSTAKKIVTIGSVTQDIFLDITSENLMQCNINNTSCIAFEEGEKIGVQSIHCAIGGGAINAAATLKLLEHDVYPVCKIANDAAGKFILEQLHKKNIPTDYVIRNAQKPTALSFILPTPSGNRTILAYRGAHKTITKDDIPFELFTTSDALYITSFSDALELLTEVLQKACAKKLFIALNPGKKQLKNKAFAQMLTNYHVDIFLTNVTEAKTFAQTLHLSPFSLATYTQEILKKGVKIVVVTRGAQGVFIATQEKTYSIPALAMTIKNSVGAGDAFGSCFFGMILHGKSIEEAASAGLRNSAAILQGHDAQDGLLNFSELTFSHR